MLYHALLLVAFTLHDKFRLVCVGCSVRFEIRWRLSSLQWFGQILLSLWASPSGWEAWLVSWPSSRKLTPSPWPELGGGPSPKQLHVLTSSGLQMKRSSPFHSVSSPFLQRMDQTAFFAPSGNGSEANELIWGFTLSNTCFLLWTLYWALTDPSSVRTFDKHTVVTLKSVTRPRRCGYL